MLDKNRGKYLVGKVKDFKKRKGWFFSHFADDPLLKSDLVEVAWQDISDKKADAKDSHYHKESVEINIVLSGQVNLKIEDKETVVTAGEFYIIWPYTTVSDVSAKKNTCYPCPK